MPDHLILLLEMLLFMKRSIDVFSSPQWDEIDESERDRLDHSKEENGEWWMDFEAFKYFFSDITICTIGPDFYSEGAPSDDQYE